MLEEIERLCKAILVNIGNHTAQPAFNKNLEELSTAIDSYLITEHQATEEPSI